MENTLKNKLFVYKSYFWFILYFIIITFFWDYDDVDVTGFGITIVYTLVGLFAGLEIICTINSIRKKENGEEYLTITFERPMDYGFDTYVIELPSYRVVLEDGKYEVIHSGNIKFYC